MVGAEPIQNRNPDIFLGLPRGCRVPRLGPSSTAFPGHRQGAGWEVGPPGLEPAPTWDPGMCKGRTAARLPRWACNFQSKVHQPMYSKIVLFMKCAQKP